MRVGIIEILAFPSQRWIDSIYHLSITKQYASITPQVVSVWCRQLGHETFYAVYYGVGDPLRLLPKDLDIVFVACYTQTSAMAYALAKVYRQAGIRTVLGGHHAKSYPADCLRFFDWVVKECDKDLIEDILAGRFEPGTFISSAQAYAEVPTVEERLPEIRASAFVQGKWPASCSTVPILASMGCTYTCDFCSDWDNPYRLLSIERLEEDLHYVANKLPGVMVGFHDPNFAIKFDTVFDVLESIPPESRFPYIMECSLSILNTPRMKRLKASNCISSLHGIESWADYSGKSGVGKQTGQEKVDKVVEHFERLADCVPLSHACFIFGLDTDMGDEPVELTKDFMERTPLVWPSVIVPIPLGGTPLFQRHLAENRILRSMPFMFYLKPYLAITLKNYDPVGYFERLMEMSAFIFSDYMLKRRLQNTSDWRFKFIYRARSFNEKKVHRIYRRTLDMLRSDSHFRAFHEGRSEMLPEFYQNEYDRVLGSYAGLLSHTERTPDLTQLEPVLAGSTEQPPLHE